MARLFACLMVGAALVIAGCSGAKESADGSAAEGQSAADAKGAESAGPEAKETAKGKASNPADPIPVDRTRRSTEGRWFVVLSMHTSQEQPRRDLYPLLVEIVRKEDGSYEAALVAHNMPPDAKPALQSAEITETKATLLFQVGGGPVEFTGTLDDGIVWGNVVMGGQQVEPARLIATNSDSLEAHADPENPPGMDELIEAISGADRAAGFKKFAEKHPESPLALDAAQQALLASAAGRPEADEFQELAELYHQRAGRWGPRMQQWARITVGMVLLRTGSLPEVALKSLDQAEEELAPAMKEAWQPLIAILRKQVHAQQERLRVVQAIDEAREMIADDDQEKQTQGVQKLRDLQKKNAFNPVILHALAGYADRQGDHDEALSLYAQIVALPMIEAMLAQELYTREPDAPRAAKEVERLWKEKHDNTDKLDAYLTEVYKKSVNNFVGEKPEPRPSDGGTRVALCELFTSSYCPPCVAADVAAGGIEATYPHTDVIVLRYHQHLPSGPDPLTNEATEHRFVEYYGGMGTPMLFVNGVQVPDVGGFLAEVDGSYSRLREAIDPVLAEKTDISIKLSAQAEGGILSISAEVEGLDEPTSRQRLRLVLAEEEVDYLAGNGIRSHEMVVRSMPGGPAGIAPDEGRLAYRASIKLSDIKQELIDYLTTFELGQGEEFPVKPLDLTKLHLVAFVQDDATREVIQAAVIPVSGKLEYPGSAKAQPAPSTDEP